MTLTENALKYDDRSVYSLQELRQFLADRNIPFRFTRAQSHTKTFYKRDREERRKMTALLRKADDAATIRFFELAPELRDEIYDYYLEGTTRDEALTEDEVQNRLRCVSKRFGEEAGDVLKRGTYQFRPRTADKSSALAETVWGTLVMTPARQTTSRSRVRPPSLPTRINGLVMRGPAGIGKSSFRSALPSLWTSPWYSASDTVELPLSSPSALRYMDGEILGAPGEGKRYQMVLCIVFCGSPANWALAR